MSRVQLGFRVSISLLLAGVLATRLDWPGLGRVFAAAEGRQLAAVMLASPVLVVMLALRLQLLLRTQGLVLPFVALWRLTWAGQFFNTFLPGTTGGDVFKLYEIGRLAPQARAEGVAAVVVDRLLALLALTLLAFGAFAAEPAPLLQLLRNGVDMNRNVAIAASALLAAGLATMVLRDRFPVGGRFANFLAAVAAAVAVARRSVRVNRLTVAAAALALATHLGNFLAVFLLARALHIGITFPQTLLMMPVVLLVIMLPITINGHGLREVAMIGYFGLMDIGGGSAHSTGAQVAVALSLAFVANDLLCALPGGLWLLFFPQRESDLRVPASASA